MDTVKRQRYERELINLYRSVYTTEDEIMDFLFRQCKVHNFTPFFDYTFVLPRDIKCKILDLLDFTDVISILETAQHWKKTTEYDLYWKNRYIREFFNKPPTRPMVIITGRGKNLTETRIPWFYAYEYINRSRDGAGRNITFGGFIKKHYGWKGTISAYPDIHDYFNGKIDCIPVEHKYWPEPLRPILPDPCKPIEAERLLSIDNFLTPDGKIILESKPDRTQVTDLSIVLLPFVFEIKEIGKITSLYDIEWFVKRKSIHNALYKKVWSMHL